MEILQVPQGEFRLARYPIIKKELLRAWDAADEYLLNHFFEENKQARNLNILIANDNFGALTTILSEHDLTVWTDSWLAQEGIKQNLVLNDLFVDTIKIKNSLETIKGDYDVVLIKIPKSLALLEDQLIRIKPYISKSTKVIAAGMVKSIHTSTLKLFEKYIGPTKTSLAKKKARLIFTKNDKQVIAVDTPYPKSYVLEGTSYTVLNNANVFSREKLDIGTRFFIQHIPHSEQYEKIIDLACGNGIVGLLAAEKNPNAELVFLDESFMAVDSAKQNMLNSQLKNKAYFEVGDCLSGIENNSVDLILNNPPFHQNNAVGDETAWKMFNQSKNALKKDGELWVIGNRHLGYHVKLKKIFNNCITVATNKKFVILKAINL